MPSDPHALLVAELHKPAEREAAPQRTSTKDGLDVLRIVQADDPEVLGARLQALGRSPLACEVTVEARDQLARLFGRKNAFGTSMAIQATAGLEEPATIAASCDAVVRAGVTPGNRGACRTRSET